MIDWSIAQNALAQPDPGQRFMQGLQLGQQQHRERQVQGAYDKLATNPDDPAAANALMRFAPEQGLRYRQQQVQFGQQQTKLQQEKHDRDTKVIASMARNARDPASWDAAVDQIVAMGYPEAAKFKGKFSPAVRSAIMAAGGIEDEPQDVVVIDGVAMDKRTGQPLYESPYPRIVSGQGGIYEQPRIGIGRGGGLTAPAGHTVAGELPPGWVVIDEGAGGAGSGPHTFP